VKSHARALYFSAFQQHKAAYLGGLFSLVVTSSAEVLVPKFTQWILDLLVNAQLPAWLPPSANRASDLNALVAGLSCVLFCGWCGRVGWRQTLARRTHNAGFELKSRIWDALRFQPIRTFRRIPLGDIMSRATADWNAARIIHGFTLVVTVDLILFMSLAIVSMLMIHAPLTLMGLIGFPLAGPFIVWLARREYAQHLLAQEKLSALSNLVSQTITSVRLQRATNSDESWQNKLEAAASTYAASRLQVLNTSWHIFPFGTLPTVITYAVLMTYGIHEIAQGTLSLGGFVAMQSYVLLMQAPLFELAAIFTEWQTGLAGMERLSQLYDLADRERPGSPIQTRPVDHVLCHLQNVGLTYSDARIPALCSVDLVLRTGESVGITGPIGSGKSSLLMVLAGLVAPTQGHYYLVGHDSRELGREGFRSQVVLVSQKAFLFAGTIRKNLEIGHHIAAADLWDALQMVGMADEVAAMPQGLDSWVGELGINLSGGQRQRLALARALLFPRSLMLFDDCLSAVDAVKASRILDMVGKRLAGTTRVWVAHRASNLRDTQRRFTMSEGILKPLTQAKLTQGSLVGRPQ